MVKVPLLKNPPRDNSAHEVLVLGCGVIGLTTALALQQSGYKVTIWAKDLPPNTTSNKAGAYWYPYSIFPESKVRVWAQKTFEFYRDFLSRDPRAGVKKASCVHFFQETKSGKNFYDAFVENVRIADKEELPAKLVHGEVLETYAIDVDRTMEYLVSLVSAAGGRIVRKTVKDISEAFEKFPVVINCTGLGSMELFQDKSMFPARGQTVVVRGNGHETVVSTHTDKVAYIIPRGGDVVLGGTFQRDNWSLEVSEQDTREIFEKCSELYPYFARDKVDVIREKVGLRPCRPEVRVEPQRFPGNRLVVHNYGHGGGGWTTCYGCALDVVQILSEQLPPPSSSKL